MCTKEICKKLYKYFSYAFSTTGKRMLTLVDVVTDVRTFLILWNDAKSTSISYLLLASISTPMLVYWASSHNFDEAIIAHKIFGKKRPTNCCEYSYRKFYNLVALPVIGVYLVAIQIMTWWILDLFLGCFCQFKHKVTIEMLSLRNFVTDIGTDKRFRNMPILMPSSAAKYFTILELFYESIPQCLLQMYVWYFYEVKYFTLNDVYISVGSSLLNIFLNVLDINYSALQHSMSFSDYLLYFMSGRINEMLISGVPVKRMLRNIGQDECNISGFTTFYKHSEAITNLIHIIQEDDICGKNILILPKFSKSLKLSDKQFRNIVRFLILAKRHDNLHVTLEYQSIPPLLKQFVSSSFVQESYDAIKNRNKYCSVKCASMINSCLGFCGMNPGDSLCATNAKLLGHKIIPHYRCCLCCKKHVKTEYKQTPMDAHKHVITDISNRPNSIYHIIWYLIIGDHEILKNCIESCQLNTKLYSIILEELNYTPPVERKSSVLSADDILVDLKET